MVEKVPAVAMEAEHPSELAQRLIELGFEVVDEGEHQPPIPRAVAGLKQLLEERRFPGSRTRNDDLAGSVRADDRSEDFLELYFEFRQHLVHHSRGVAERRQELD